MPSPAIACAIAIALALLAASEPETGSALEGRSVSGRVLVAIREDCGAEDRGWPLCDVSCDVTVGVAMAEVLGGSEAKGGWDPDEAAGSAT